MRQIKTIANQQNIIHKEKDLLSVFLYSTTNNFFRQMKIRR